MTEKEFVKYLEWLNNKEKEILEDKSKLYSTDSDKFHNFVQIGLVTGDKPPVVAFKLMMKHFIALRDILLRYNTISDKSLDCAEFTVIEELIIDIRNYMLLIMAMLSENLTIEE